MVRWLTSSCVLCFFVAAPPPDLFGQVIPSGAGSNTYRTNPDPRARRAHREAAVAKVGPGARDFVEARGDLAVAAIFACSKQVGVKLAEFHSSGELAKLPRPRDLLYVIGQPRYGDDVALFAMQHAAELADKDCFDTFLTNPLEYSLGLKQLTAGAEDVRKRRLNRDATSRTLGLSSLTTNQRLVIVEGAGFLLMVGILRWRRREILHWLVHKKDRVRAAFAATTRFLVARRGQRAQTEKLGATDARQEVGRRRMTAANRTNEMPGQWN